jgi:RNA polymerase sigma-70 factor, ECF subfamily
MVSREAIDVLVEVTEDSASDVVDLAAHLWERARAAHPQLGTDDVTFFSYVAERVERIADLEVRNVEDMYLACGCAQGDRAALSTLETVTLPSVLRAVAQLGGDEVVQALRTQMLVGPSPGITAYDGRAPLAIWLRVCATRIGLRHNAREKRNELLDDERLDVLAPGVPDPELAYLQRHYGAQFRKAFAEAVAALAPRERNLLRHAVIDGLGIDQIAAIYHVHRATAARQLKQVRATLVANTRERMRLTLGIGETELDSIFRVLVAMTGITLREILRPEPRKSEG